MFFVTLAPIWTPKTWLSIFPMYDLPLLLSEPPCRAMNGANWLPPNVYLPSNHHMLTMSLTP